MAKESAGILLYRISPDGVEVLLAHPGGPFWANRDHGAWSIPKGELEAGEDPRASALREFEEELGTPAPTERLIELGSITQASGKRVTAWAAEGDLDPATVRSNTFTAEWPPRSGRLAEFPEIDRVQWFDPDEARGRINAAQAELIDRLLEQLDC